jgi:TonB family protein
MRVREGVLVVVCAGVAFGGAHLSRAQEAASANLPDQFQTGEMMQIQKSKSKKADPSSQTVATAPKQNTARVPEQAPVPEELPPQVVTEEKTAEPSRSNVSTPPSQKVAPVTEQAPPIEESAIAAAPVEKKPRPKKRPSAPVQPEVASIAAPVPMSLSVAQSMAISAPLPQYSYEAKRRKLTGSGVCVVTVDTATGTVTDARMFQSTGSPVLDKLTIQTFKSWRFKPGTVSQVRVPISYE